MVTTKEIEKYSEIIINRLLKVEFWLHIVVIDQALLEFVYKKLKSWFILLSFLPIIFFNQNLNTIHYPCLEQKVNILLNFVIYVHFTSAF